MIGMRRVGLSRVAMRLMLAAGAAALVAGCSDASRFSADPFSDPFENSRPRAVAARPQRVVDRAPTGSIPATPIQSQPLAPPASNVSAAPHPVQAAQAAPAPSAGSYNHWSAEGGTPITVAEGDSVAVLANRYGVPTEVLLKVNGYSSAAQVRPGSRIVIPVYRANGTKSQVASEKPARAVEAKHLAKEDADEGDRSGKSSRKTAVAVKNEKAKLAAKSEDDEDEAKQQAKKGRAKPEKAKLSSKDDEDGTKSAVKNSAKAKLAKKDEGEEKAQVAPKAKIKTAKVEPEKEVAPAPVKKQSAKNAAEPRAQTQVAVNGEAPERAPAPEPRKTEKSAPAPAAAAAPAPAQEERASDGAHPEFRWPARGRIIQGFASGGNDGINIAVPEGTQVKAAESGVVAYAGNELKGYGNLVLIRHPNGFVTAYAHNGDLAVKRGDQVTRGQTIAKSGQSGNVATPQLHFELRKGSTPVDPTNYLAGL